MYITDKLFMLTSIKYTVKDFYMNINHTAILITILTYFK